MGTASKRVAEDHGVAIYDCPALDVDYLERVTFGESALRDELLGLFLAQVSGLIVRLPLIGTAQDWRFSTHSLRGAAAAIGANEIADLCARWEEQGLPPIPAERRVRSNELQNAATRFREALTALKG